MGFTDTAELKSILDTTLHEKTNNWIQEKLDTIIETRSAKDLYMTYSLLTSKVQHRKKLILDVLDNKDLSDYLTVQKATALHIARMYLLTRVLEENGIHFQPKVANLIQVADTGELETFLKFLILLPDAENYKQVAVEALRTNIATVFNAISADNPYPAKYFDDRQWNQMYLKAAFMQQDLSRILEVDRRANTDLARIISDYAHERWSASRKVDPQFWRPVAGFLTDSLLEDMKRLLESDDSAENKAGALCCFRSDNPKAISLLEQFPHLKNQVTNGEVAWNNLKKTY